MNPLIITVVILVGTALAGILGTLLALPIAGTAQILLQDALARQKARWGEPPEGEPRQLSLGPLWEEEQDGSRPRAPH